MLLRIWTACLAALAIVAGAVIGLMFLFIVADVVLRSVGSQPPLWTTTFVEFGLLYSTVLAAPWLISRDGHIRVRALTDRLPPSLIAKWETVMFLVLASLTGVLAWYALDVTWDSARRGEVEYRSIILPRWVLFAPLAPCFLLMSIEFLRASFTGLGDRSGAEDADRSL